MKLDELKKRIGEAGLEIRNNPGDVVPLGCWFGCSNSCNNGCAASTCSSCSNGCSELCPNGGCAFCTLLSII